MYVTCSCFVKKPFIMLRSLRFFYHMCFGIFWIRFRVKRQDMLRALNMFLHERLQLLYNMHVSCFYHNSWIMLLENTMNECGYSGIWSNQTLNVSLNLSKNLIKTRLNDKYCQLWRSDVFWSNKCLNYWLLKDTLSIGKVLIKSSSVFFWNPDV